MSLEDAVAREHIRDTVARYNIAGDSLQAEAFVNVFTDDAVFCSPVFKCEGKAAVAKVASKWQEKPKRPTAKFVRHNITTTQIDLTGPDTAAGKVYYVVFTDIGPDHSGHYLDKYRKVGDRWLICYREALMDWSHPDSLFVPEKVKRWLAELSPDDAPFTPIGKNALK